MREKTAELLASLAHRRLRELRTQTADLGGRIREAGLRAEAAAGREAAALLAVRQADAAELALLGTLAEGARSRRAAVRREQAALEARLAPLVEELRGLRAEERRWRQVAARLAARAERRRARRTERMLEDLAALRSAPGRAP